MYDAVLLDRDGVINRERPDYVKAWHELEFLPGALPALARLASLDRPILVMTNQSAIGRGLVSADAVRDIHERVRLAVESHGGKIDAFYVCPHRPDEGCSCRKPKPGLLLQAATDFKLDLRQCVFVGDSITDREAAMAVGCRSVLVATGRQGADLLDASSQNSELTVLPDLAAAVELILTETSHSNQVQK